MRKILCIALAAAVVMPYGYGAQMRGEERDQFALLKNEFISNAENGNLSKVKELIKEDLKKETPELTDPTYGVLDEAIKAAIDSGHAKVVEYLITTKNAKINTKTNTDLQYAKNELTPFLEQAQTKRGNDKKTSDYKRYDKVVKVIKKERARLQKMIDRNIDREQRTAIFYR
ncbi:MAG: hypothetical protein WCW33_01420 [Candidatus Babeliales bacterium]|jgi:hypothetical protein